MIENILLLATIVESGSISAASRKIGMSVASVSERLASLEKTYATTLLRRTTRKSSLTEEGKLLVDFARRMLADKAAVDELIRGDGDVRGNIRFSAPRDFGSRLIPHVDAFLGCYQNVTVEVSLTDGYVDLVEEGLDFAIRLGPLNDSTLIQKKIACTRRIVCAAPSYLAGRCVPTHPSDLRHHDCVIMRFGATLDNQWPFSIDGQIQKVAVRGQRIIDDGLLARSWCKQGYGIAFKSYLDIREDIESGALVPLLEDYSIGSIPIQIVYPGSKQVVRRVKCLIDFISMAFQPSDCPGSLTAA